MNSKIVLLTFFIIAFSFLVASILLVSNLLQEREQAVGERAMLIARTVSNLPEIKQQLEQEDIEHSSSVVQGVVKSIRIINNAEYIVVLNMDRVRLSHPVAEQIGTVSESSDIQAAFAENYYLSKAEGENGITMRALVPVMNDQKVQIGVVVVGFALPTIMDLMDEYKSRALVAIILSLIISIWGALTLGRHIKRQMYDLEPDEIAKIYTERTETFNVMHEGIIAVDKDLNITIFNEKAGIILGVTEHPSRYIGKSIYAILPDTRLPEIVFSEVPVYNQEIYVNEHSIISTRIPIYVDGKITGAVAVFRDLTEVKKMAEELTGVKAFVQALRIQTHEYKNKLHTIAGLLQLGHSEQALKYLSQVQMQHDDVTKFLNERIYNENISGLLLSKISRGNELGIRVIIDQESKLTTFPDYLDHHDFVILLGNLIENAFDAFKGMDHEDKEITISIDDNDGILALLVSDNGCGIKQEYLEQIFDHGFTTKNSENNGIGLYLIKEIVTKGNGVIDITTEENKGTTFMITFEL